MSKPDLTAERLRELLHYDPETGVFTCLVYRGANAKAGQIAGCPEQGYIRIKIDLRLYRAHRLAWLYMTGEWPKNHVDHIDTDRANNRWANLRAATHAENVRNQRRPHAGTKSGVLGVSPTRDGKFQASITICGVSKYLGRFPTVELAHAAYVKAKRLHHPSNTL